MKTEVTDSREVGWLAKGCWDHHYYWRFHPATKQDWLIAFIVGGIGLLVVIIGALGDAVRCPECGPSQVAVLGAVLLIVGFAFFFKGQHTMNREKQDYIDHAIDRWANGDGALPSLENLKNWAPGFEKPKNAGGE